MFTSELFPTAKIWDWCLVFNSLGATRFWPKGPEVLQSLVVSFAASTAVVINFLASTNFKHPCHADNTVCQQHVPLGCGAVPRRGNELSAAQTQTAAERARAASAAAARHRVEEVGCWCDWRRLGTKETLGKLLAWNMNSLLGKTLKNLQLNTQF